jgi:low temperature requirement protein LtrA
MTLPVRIPPPVLWSARPPAAHRRVTWVELFFDLVFVAVVAQVGAPLAADYSLHALGRYTFLLTVIWWAWNGYAVYATRFDARDAVQRATTLLQMVAVIFMAANAEDDLSSESSAGFAAAYAVMRLILVAEYLRASGVPAARRLAREYAVGFGAAALLWLASAMAPPGLRFALWGLALAVDVGTAIVAARHTTTLPPDAWHLPERFGLFTLILLGESIVAIIKGIQSQPDWSVPAAAAAFSGIGLVFAVWWAYFEGAAGPADRHVRTRRDARWFELWSYAHLPIYLGLALAGVGIEHIVRSGADVPLHFEEAFLLSGAVALIIVAVSLVALASDRVGARTRQRLLVSGAGFGAATLAAAPLAHYVPASFVVAGLALLAMLHAARLVRVRAEGGDGNLSSCDSSKETLVPSTSPRQSSVKDTYRSLPSR